jgi:hypothetical protein
LAANQNTQRLWKQPGRPPRLSWLYKSLDAILTAPLKPKGRAAQLFWMVIKPRSSNSNRISSLVNLLDRFTPGLALRLAAALMRTQHLPLAGYNVSLLAYGSGATVFMLDNGRERSVLKVFRRSLARPVDEVLEVAREFQKKHALLTGWFNDPYQIVIPSTFLVLHGPLMGAGAAAVLQPFVGGEKSDIFLDYSTEEAVHLLQSNPHLKAQWIDFTHRFLKSMEETNTCFDLVGRENLMLVEQAGKLSFNIADNGVFNIATIRTHAPALYTRLQAHCERLNQINRGIARS